MTVNFRIIDGKKFMWDGEEYETKAQAQENVRTYRKDHFETRLIEEENRFLVYTRRVVTEITVAGEAV